MLISTALLLDSNIRNSVCTPAKLPCRRVEVGYEKYYKTWRFLNMTCHDFQFGQDLVICTRRIKSAGYGKLLSKLFTEK
jgi:hypothetical protein